MAVAPASSTESGDHVLLDAGVIGLGDNPGTKLLAVGTVIADCVIPAPADVVRVLERSNFQSGASDTRVVTSLEKNSSMVCKYIQS